MVKDAEIISEALDIAVQKAQQEAEIRNAAIRQAERQAKMDAWKDPEAMVMRKALAEKGAIESLWKMRAAGQCDPIRDFPLPPKEQLPKDVAIQQPSYIRKWMWGNFAWRPKMEKWARDQKIAEEARTNVMKKHPELWGIDYATVQKLIPDDFKPEPIRTGSPGFTVKDSAGPKVVLESVPVPAAKAPAEPGFMTKLFAGIGGQRRTAKPSKP